MIAVSDTDFMEFQYSCKLTFEMTAYLNISVCPALSNVSFLLSVRMAVKIRMGSVCGMLP